MRRGLIAARAVLLTAVLAAGLWTSSVLSGTPARADGVEYLMVPSAAMGRDIPVAFQGGGPHAVFLLDAFNAAPDVSNWVNAGHAMSTLAGRGISVAAPAGGAWSLYTNWEQDGSKQWDTFLSSELPDWLAANKGLAPGGHAAVGASQGGDLSYAIATGYGERVSMAIPLLGTLDGSPLAAASSTSPSIVALDGDADPIVPAASARAFTRRLRAAGYAVTLRMYPQVGHDISPAMREDLHALLGCALQRRAVPADCNLAGADR